MGLNPTQEAQLMGSDCGSAVYGEERDDFPWRLVWWVSSDCVKKKSAVRDCVDGSYSSVWGLEVKCSDSVRLVSGPSLCSGSVQIWDQSWTWVCEGALDQQGAEVLCRELGCGAPSLLQGALSPLRQTFHCEGHESALMDCPRSGSETCSSGAALNLTCSEPLRLVGGASRCAGTVEVKHRGEWGRVEPNGLRFMEHTAAVCRDLDCGSAVYGEWRDDFPESPVWRVSSDCVEKKSAVRECVYGTYSYLGLEVRLVSGPSLCSGSVQIWDQSWTWVCEGALDQQGAEVLCRELGCGAPSLLQGALSPLRQTFHCEGHESALMDCPRSGSETCSSGAAVNLTCSEPLRLVGGASRCAGTVELRHRGEWRRVQPNGLWVLENTAAVCRDLDCGSAVYGEWRDDFPQSQIWRVSPDCVKKSAVRECVDGSYSSSWGLEVKCSDSVRLVSGPSLCSGSVQIWDQSWTWVCEGALDQQGAEVLCRELGCGAPSLLQGALSPLRQTFHCEGHESALMDCPRSGSETCSSGAAVNLTCSEPLRLVGGASRCAGTVEVKHRGEWRRMSGLWDLKHTAAVCRDLDCGIAVYGEDRDDFPQSQIWSVSSDCVKKKSAVRHCVKGSSSSLPSGLEIWDQSWTWVCEGALDQQGAEVLCRELGCGALSLLQGALSPLKQTFHCEGHESALMDCPRSDSETCSSGAAVNLTCSDSVRLVSGPSLCSGSVQIWDQSWTWVCEGALDQQGAEVLCRELGCGAPSLLQGALSPLKQTFHCEGHESALMDCPRSGSETCSSGAAVNLTCSEPLRLVGGASRCAGTVEVRHRGEWRRMSGLWNLKHTAAVCRDLDCGSAVDGENRRDFPKSPVWWVSSDCVTKKTAVRDCVVGSDSSSSSGLEVKCSDSVRLVSGPSLCSGSVQIWDQSWTWVCEGALDQQGAEVLCRELGCGAPSLLQGALSPLRQTFHCEGHESALMDCPRSDSETCSSGAAVNLTCSELRLVGGASRCAGTVEVKHRGEWRRVQPSGLWFLKHTAAVCRDLDCGSVVYGEERDDFLQSPVWRVLSDCVKKKSAVRHCVFASSSSSSSSSSSGLEVKCSDSVRLVSGPSLCSGSVQIWDQSWTWVCEGALDQQGAEVLCRELGCGAPSLLQGALSPLRQTFHCEGHESALMDCPRSGSETCSSGAAVNLTCSEPLRLVGGASRCAGTVELRLRGEWGRVEPNGLWFMEHTAAVCRDLDCGSAVYGEKRDDFPQGPVWTVSSDCVKKSAVRDCVVGSDSSSSSGLKVKCSDSVRLVSGPSLCSGSVQIWDQSWTWVCEGALDQQGAEVLCRELGCGAPSLLQGALSPLRQTFHCEGHESALMDCPRSGSETCSSGAAVNLTCSEPLRLVGGASRCAGTVELRQRGEWRRVEPNGLWFLKHTAASPVWRVSPVKKSAVRDFVDGSSSFSSSSGLEVKCSDSVRLVSGPSLCSGSVQIWDQSWTWVCEGALDQQGAEVLCRELGCGAPSLLQGALSPLRQTFHCEGHESALMDCPRSGSETCSSGAAVNITCSEPIRSEVYRERALATLSIKPVAR
ncbi:deleted in malignant brain tumors 1 protein-like [Periophthalmus magnuspinnatus]|uniref:deleted in malignant brain tumors 1 protein-like n=1 Tax=Periophthalmus magnuspinnatus TaxID=409849 RepID=UPI002436632C|nr:deleted in malignant brain tumors 1 protein-like [Periophthalmus magnuspinnatus]